MRKSVALLVLVFAASAAFAQDGTKVIVASDDRSRISVPSSWETMDLNDSAEIEVGNEQEEAYLIVLNELKDDLYGWNLEKHSRVTLGNLLSGLAFPTITGPKALTIGKSQAVQYEIRGASNNRNIVYIHTTIDGPTQFSQILAWTLPSKVDSARPKLLEAIRTFRENE